MVLNYQTTFRCVYYVSKQYYNKFLNCCFLFGFISTVFVIEQNTFVDGN